MIEEIIHAQKDSPKCFLTMDLENDCGGRIGPVFDTIHEENIFKLVHFINKQEVPLTLFVTGRLFEEKRKELKLIQSQIKQVEFALHSYSHPNLLDDYSEEIERAVAAYEDFMGARPLGYRAPQGKISGKDFESLQRHRFQYDSSIIPTIRPGVFNNRKRPNRPFPLERYDLLEIPCSVFPIIHIPMGLGFMRMLGPSLTKIFFARLPLPPVIVLVFHLHDIVQTEHVDNLKGFWKFFYQRKVDQGFVLLDFVIKNLKKKGYRFDLMKNISSTAIRDFQP
jgi:Polysaccharide deacetylase